MAYAARYRPKPATDIFTNDTDIDRRTCSRKVPMKVLLLGLGRTGTASMRAAMRQLGYEDTYHMMSCSIENPPDALMWHDALLAKYHGIGKPFTRADWDRLLGHCQAVCDWPAAAFAPELVAAYPEAKVVLATRDDPAAWHASTLKTFFWRAHDPALAALARFDWAASMYQPMIRLFFATFFEDAFWGGRAGRYTRAPCGPRAPPRAAREAARIPRQRPLGPTLRVPREAGAQEHAVSQRERQRALCDALAPPEQDADAQRPRTARRLSAGVRGHVVRRQHAFPLSSARREPWCRWAESRVREPWSKGQEGGEARREPCLLRVRDLGPGWWRHIHLRVCWSERGKLFGRFLCGVRVLLLQTHGSFRLFT
ncbi:conserved hypothetical protein [Verticillium alfalfae VaMs.102]|uniref:NAD dependent epimerase/dehydratase n=1 Tax=Verticillium alfalfae (strain VaMs.102 / ATCC MYA-4576 / FGSC 10136) TaxID=526221 RepID=C9SHI1_VERA1|nr:conserved hypothetical protein [Verticillium alfalfae VaMs.102]EEY18404.1 conserved hypothetical protein [Verticillium alfalfae VaMs.102]